MNMLFFFGVAFFVIGFIIAVSEIGKKQKLLWAGILAIILGLALIAGSATKVGRGHPKAQEKMKLHRVYEVINTIEDNGKCFAVLREPDGKLKFYLLLKASEAKHVKIVEDEKGVKRLQPFPSSLP